MQRRRRRRRRRRCRRRGEWLSGFENELLKNSITLRGRGNDDGGEGRERGPGSGNGGASSDWSGREEIASRLVIITPLTQLPSPPIALPIIFVIEPFGAHTTKSPSSWLLRSSAPLPRPLLSPHGHTIVLLHARSTLGYSRDQTRTRNREFMRPVNRRFYKHSYCTHVRISIKQKLEEYWLQYRIIKFSHLQFPPPPPKRNKIKEWIGIFRNTRLEIGPIYHMDLIFWRY